MLFRGAAVTEKTYIATKSYLLKCPPLIERGHLRQNVPSQWVLSEMGRGVNWLPYSIDSCDLYLSVELNWSITIADYGVPGTIFQWMNRGLPETLYFNKVPADFYVPQSFAYPQCLTPPPYQLSRQCDTPCMGIITWSPILSAHQTTRLKVNIADINIQRTTMTWNYTSDKVSYNQHVW